LWSAIDLPSPKRQQHRYTDDTVLIFDIAEERRRILCGVARDDRSSPIRFIEAAACVGAPSDLIK
jgi:hypothetical protein